MTRLIGIAGAKRSGKDTFSDYLMLELMSTRYSNIRYSFATPLYRMIEVLLGRSIPALSNGEYDKEAIILPYGVSLRTFLQTLGTEWGRDKIHEDIWVMHAQQVLDRTRAEVPATNYIIFSDIRFVNEAKFIIANGGVVIRVNRYTTENAGGTDTHRSEIPIPEEYVTWDVDNSGSLDDLHKIAKSMANHELRLT